MPILSATLDKRSKILISIWNWLEKKGGRIIYADDPDFKREWQHGSKTGDAYQFWYGLYASNKLKRLSSQEVTKGEAELKKILKNKNYELQSDDKHIIVAALAGKVKLLVSHDKNLGTDFKQLIDKSSIYKNKGHSHLLEGYTCP